MTPADLRSLIAAMRDYPSAYAANNDNLASFCYGVLVGAGDDRVRDAWRAAVAHVLYPDDHGSMEPEWSTHPTLRVVDVFERAAFSLDLTTDAPDAPAAGHAVALVIQAQMVDDAEPMLARIAAMGYPTIAEIGRRAKAAP